MTIHDGTTDHSSSVHRIEPLGDSGAGRLDDSVGDDSDVLALELDQLITDYFELQRSGQAPSPDEFIARHPEHEHALRAVLPGASLLDQLGKRAEDATPLSRSGERLGEFKLLGILGRGGMGVVYEAVQEALDRPVALKVLPASRVIDRKSRERFMREAQAAASLQHPGIVPVYGVGEAEGQVYYAMQRIDGVPLDVLTAAARGDSVSSESTMLVSRAATLAAKLRGTRMGEPSPALPLGASLSESSTSEGGAPAGRSWIDNVVHIGLQAAEALSYAHSRGVLHRDVKPSNLMLDDEGRVFVTDFGLCKTADNSSLTAAGDVVGTLRYVPPERFHGRDDARGDVYGLGMILYELLCGRPAFPQRNRAELVQAVTLHAPPRPRKLNREIPEDLETIVLTATAQLPEERYASMEALISDLVAFQKGRAILARAPGKLYLARLFARRNRALVLTVAIALLLLLGTGVTYVLNLKGLVRELSEAQELAQQSTYHAEVGAAASAIVGNQESLARRHLAAVPESARDWIWETMAARLQTSLLVADGGLDEVLAGALDGDEVLLALVREDGVRVSDVATGDLIAELPVAGATCVGFLPGADVVVAAGAGRDSLTATPFRTGDSEAAAAARWFLGEVRRFGLSPVESISANGEHLALSTVAGEVVICSSHAAGEVRKYQCAPGSGGQVVLFGTRGAAAHAVRGDQISVLGPEPGRIRTSQVPQRGPIQQLSGARDVERFAVLTSRQRLQLFSDLDHADLKRLDQPTIPGSIQSLVLAPNGEGVVTCARNGTLRLWRPGAGTTVGRARALRSGASVLLWPNGGDTLVSAGALGDWRVTALPAHSDALPGVSRSRAQYRGASALTVDAAGTHYASADIGGAWAVWSAERRLPVATEIDELRRLVTLGLEIDGPRAWLALGGDGLRMVTWDDLHGGEWSIESIEGPGDVLEVGWAGPEGNRRLIAVERGGRLFEVRRGETTARLIGSASARLSAATIVGASGDVVLALEDAPVLEILRAEGGVERLADLHLPAHTMGCDATGEVLAVCTQDQLLKAYRFGPSGLRAFPWEAQVAELGQQRYGASTLAVDSEAGWIVTGSSDGALRTWALESGRSGPELLSIYGKIAKVIFPRPGGPPVAIEYRGRIDHFELDGVDRTNGVPDAEPTAVEARALESGTASARLRSIQRHLERGDLTLEEARLLEVGARGIDFYARFNPQEVSVEEARAAYLEVAEIISSKEAEQDL